MPIMDLTQFLLRWRLRGLCRSVHGRRTPSALVPVALCSVPPGCTAIGLALTFALARPAASGWRAARRWARCTLGRPGSPLHEAKPIGIDSGARAAAVLTAATSRPSATAGAAAARTRRVRRGRSCCHTRPRQQRPLTVRTNRATVGTHGRSEPRRRWARPRGTHQRCRAHRRARISLACHARRCRPSSAAARRSRSSAAAQSRTRGEVGAVTSCAARAADAAEPRPSLRPSTSSASAGVAAMQAALEARLAAREVGGEPAPPARPVRGTLTSAGWSRDAAPRPTTSSRASAAASACLAPEASPETLLQHTLHGLDLLLLLAGECVEEARKPSSRSAAPAAPSAAADIAAARPAAVATRAAAARAAASPSHAAPVVSGKGTAGRLNGQQAACGLAQPPLAAVPRLLPRRGGGSRARRRRARARRAARRRGPGGATAVGRCREAPPGGEAAAGPWTPGGARGGEGAQRAAANHAREEEAANHGAWQVNARR